MRINDEIQGLFRKPREYNYFEDSANKKGILQIIIDKDLKKKSTFNTL